ncbi:Rrf2 family transcriptional regulator [Shouchella lonarensis]|uniref:HTH-type transcriptional regulator NsrR n=1 Tax=Shouchella lonarensis TaxID=1464122 RepID=A0A1G6GKE1_9BACI|nr:Rrf2 family transcriptional regulator [Shouchella lonarensis]SDB82420.1 transcriptional regulator, BadM/Rrf2 family [Shouchella lonarensis]
MRLTLYSDYTLRVLIYLHTHNQGKLANIQEIAEAYGISKNHLMKVIFELGKMGYIQTIRGRNGGIRLAQQPEKINIGAVVRQTEEDFHLVECFDKENNQCIISPACGLKNILANALQAYLNVLDQYTLADLVQDRTTMQALFAQKQNQRA